MLCFSRKLGLNGYRKIVNIDYGGNGAIHSPFFCSTSGKCTPKENLAPNFGYFPKFGVQIFHWISSVPAASHLIRSNSGSLDESSVHVKKYVHSKEMFIVRHRGRQGTKLLERVLLPDSMTWEYRKKSETNKEKTLGFWWWANVERTCLNELWK